MKIHGVRQTLAKIKTKTISVSTAFVLAISGFGTALPLFLTQSASADAVTITVCDTGCDYTSLQAAVDAASAGDTISIDGTQTVTSTVVVNKPLSFVGASAAATIATSGGNDVFTINAGGAGTSIQNLNFAKSDKTSQTVISVIANNVTVSGNTFTGQFVLGDSQTSRAMVISYVSGLTVSNNHISNFRQPAYIGGATGTIANNVVSGTKSWVVVSQSNMTFTGNSGSNNAVDIAIIPDVPVGADNYYANLMAMSAANNNAVIEDQNSPVGSVMTDVYVDDSASVGGNGYPVSPYQTVTPALSRVINGGRVHVAAGTYDGFSVSGKTGISILGDNAVITPSSLISSGVQHKYTTNMQVSVLVNNSTDVTLSGLTINGNGLAPGAGGPDAVVLWNSSTGSLDDSTVNGGLNAGSINGAQTGQGIAVDGTSNLTLNNVNVSGFQKNGIDIINGNGATSGGGDISVTVNGGSISGVGPTSTIAQNGIVVWNRGGGNVTAYVNGATIQDLSYTPEPDYATGILLYAGGALDPASNATFLNDEYSVLQYTDSPTDTTVSGAGGATVTIPAGTTVSTQGDWNGTINPPAAVSVTVPAPAGYSTTVGLAISVGSDTATLTFDNPVRLVLPGQAGKLAGFIPVGGSFTPITTNCGTDPVSTPPAVMATANECVVNNGNDLVIWTNHFTTFVAYSQTANPTPSGGSGSGSSSNSAQTTSSSSSRPSVTLASATNNENNASDSSSPAVLGETTNNKNSGGHVKSTATVENPKNGSAFLGLGWWWIPIVVAALGAGAWLVVKRADGTTSSSK